MKKEIYKKITVVSNYINDRHETIVRSQFNGKTIEINCGNSDPDTAIGYTIAKTLDNWFSLNRNIGFRQFQVELTVNPL